MRVIGIDTSLRSTGFGVVETAGSGFKSVECGTISIPASQPHSVCLDRLGSQLRLAIERTRPVAAAIEGIFFCKNVKTAVILGEARGVVIATCAALDLPVYEYAPRRMKQALVGYGAAQKEQVARMVMRLLGLVEMPQEDAADGLALAICHLNSCRGLQARENKPL